MKKIFYLVLSLNIVLFSCSKNNSVSLPILTTTSVSSISLTTATTGGTISTDGGAFISVRGVCYDTITNPTTSSPRTINGTGTGSFISNISGLNPNTTYYVRAYATNSTGTSYGNQQSFTTTSIGMPSLTTTTISSISLDSAVSGGTIASNGGATITLSGVCWSINPNPTSSLITKTSDTISTGTFISNITGLAPNTTYYIRAYASNSAGTSYGNQLIFTTIAGLPIVTTDTASSITSSSATSGGNITSDGGATITEKGVCWDINPNPTISLITATAEGPGSGNFISSITGLTANVTYYVRAYATNSVGTSYGNQIRFTTPDNLVTDSLNWFSNACNANTTINKTLFENNLWGTDFTRTCSCIEINGREFNSNGTGTDVVVDPENGLEFHTPFTWCYGQNDTIIQHLPPYNLVGVVTSLNTDSLSIYWITPGETPFIGYYTHY